MSEVCIISVGARTPVGMTAPAAAAAVRAGVSAIQKHPHFVDLQGEAVAVARDAKLPADLHGAARVVALASSAAHEALGSNPGLPGDESLIMLVGVASERPGRPESLEDELAAGLLRTAGELGFDAQVQFYPYGHSAGLIALEQAWRWIRTGHCEICLVGGSDSYIEGQTLEWLDSERQLMSAKNRSGFPPGEAAGFCVLASETRVRALGLTPLAVVDRVATGMEANSIKTPSVCVGQALAEVFERLADGLERPREKIDFTYCDINGERYRAEELLFAGLRSQAVFRSLDRVAHPANSWGDVGAASGPLFACLAVAAAQRGYAEGTYACLSTSSEGGQRAAALLRLPMIRELD